MAKGIKGSSPVEDKPKATSLKVKPSTWGKIRYISFMENQDISAIVESCLQDVIKKYEKKNGPIKLPS